MKRSKSLDRVLPTLLVISLVPAVISIWSDVWELYWFIFTLFLVVNLWYFRNILVKVFNLDLYKEMLTGFPSRHKHTSFTPPSDGEGSEIDEIYTGSAQGDNLMSKKVKLLGIFSWVAWFGFGINVWWFSDTRPIEYVIATVLWIFTFLFTTLGIPFTRSLLKNRSK